MYKRQGLTHLAEEGVVQVFRPVTGNSYILGAVGLLQFDITIERLTSEYGVDAVYEPVDYHVARWVESDDPQKMADFEQKNRSNIAVDAEGARAYLTTSEWQLDYCIKEWPGIAFNKTREINEKDLIFQK